MRARGGTTDVTNAHTSHFFAVCLCVFLFKFTPRDLRLWILRKIIDQIIANVFGAQFSFRCVFLVTVCCSPLLLLLILQFKARGWWPRNRSSTKNFFWRFVFLWVTLALLNPIESFSWRGCVVQATKNKEESCSFLDAIGRRSCGPLSGLAKNRQTQASTQADRDSWSVRYGALCHSSTLPISSDLHFNSPWSLACFSSACTSLGMLLKAKFTPAI